MIKELIKLANHLDSKGLVKEADYLDGIIKSADLQSMCEKNRPTNLGKKMLSSEESDILTEIISKDIRNYLDSNIELSTLGSKDTGAGIGGGIIHHRMRIDSNDSTVSIYDITDHQLSQEAIIEIDGKFFQKFRPCYRPFGTRWNTYDDMSISLEIRYDWTSSPVDMYYEGHGE